MRKITKAFGFMIMLSFFLAFCSFTNDSPNEPKKKAGEQRIGVLWYLPTMSGEQARSIASYDFIVIDYENFINNPKAVDLFLSLNPKMDLYLYLNQTEIFDPMWTDKPWSIKVLAELQKYPQWWIKQPDGKRIGAWKGMKALDMRTDCPVVNGKKYHEWIAEKYLEILKDPRIDGCLIDNCWGDDKTGIGWLAYYQGNKGFDFDSDKKADTDISKIDESWTKGMRAYIQRIREEKGKRFTIIANPGNYSYPEVDGKQLENFPYQYHNLNGRSDLQMNLIIASRFGFAIVNPDTQDYFYGICSAALDDNLWLCIGQNTMYDKKYELDLGKPLGKKQIKEDYYVRTFEKGTIYVSLMGKKCRVEYNNGDKRIS